MNSPPSSSVHTDTATDVMSDMAHNCLSVSVATDFDVKQKIAEAKESCQQQGLRFTAQRKQIYRHILEATTPLGAYDILALMQQQHNDSMMTQSKSKSKKSVAPPTVYRGLEFLLKAGFIHQLISINAFVPCCHPRQPHLAVFLMCKQCGRVQEYSHATLRAFIEQTKDATGFLPHRSVFEISGLCHQCHC